MSDEILREKKQACRVNNSIDGTALVVERLYDGKLHVWYGVADLVCSYDEMNELGVICEELHDKPLRYHDVEMVLEDGRSGTVHFLSGLYHDVSPAGVLAGLEAGDQCFCWFVGITPLVVVPPSRLT